MTKLFFFLGCLLIASGIFANPLYGRPGEQDHSAFSQANATTNSTTSLSGTAQDDQKTKDFFKDSDYEHFAPEKGFEFVGQG